eukprot:6181219-Pleurochrysis_carterae.AAC.3
MHRLLLLPHEAVLPHALSGELGSILRAANARDRARHMLSACSRCDNGPVGQNIRPVSHQTARRHTRVTAFPLNASDAPGKPIFALCITGTVYARHHSCTFSTEHAANKGKVGAC